MFWGWGEPGAGPSLPADAGGWLRAQLGVSGEVVSRPVALGDARLPAGGLDRAVAERLAAIAPVREDRAARVLRCRGKSYLDLLASRAGDFASAPAAVVAPRTHEEVLAVLRLCSDASLAVVPFGGGTSVVGGLEHAGAVSLDLGAMDGLVSVDDRSLTAVFEPGTRLPEADRALAGHGLALGHAPQSYEWATVGGCVATRSAGQTSTGHGRIDEQVVALRCATPLGDLATLDAPASAAGPPLRELVVGSEGALGVLTRVALRVRRAPAVRRYEGWRVRGFAAGCELLRRLQQEGIAPDVARLSDEDETALGAVLAGGALAQFALGRGACLLVAGWEGTAESVARRRAPAAALLRRGGALPLGRVAGRAWAASRFAGPHLRDDLLDRGVLVETLETATSWSRLGRLHAAVRAALGAGAGVHVGGHVSHLYPTGASLYFTVLAAQDRDDPAAQWRRLKAAATDALVAAGGTITHHHAVGRDHAPWLRAEVGALGAELLRVVKERCDPAGVMNPGVLLGPSGR